ncbi:MAG: phosphate ABC transporter permease subunit PstC [Rhodospirillales bacterium CG15_BIG_FIL_POST_REV_8_21_14_020_66_15]|nr:MAG: phosphate ABC transporter permease subunit PstC [Rhodospirillales bacterium CG15_BIG_FIL_POST_REV_8_21_14_020_66_15]
MSFPVLFGVLAVLTLFGFFLGRSRAMATAGGQIRNLHSLPNYYGYYIGLWCAVPGFLLLIGWMALETTVLDGMLVAHLPKRMTDVPGAELSLLLNDIKNLAHGDVTSRQVVDADLKDAAAFYGQLKVSSKMLLAALLVVLACGGILIARGRIAPELRARNSVERAAMAIMIICSTIAVLTTLGIILSLLFESLRFFEKVHPLDFVFGLEWSPQTALRKDQVGATGLFGAIPLLAGTLLISFIAMCVAAPVGLMAAIYMSEYAPARVRGTVKPLLEILAGIPTVVYGFFAALTVAPFFRDWGLEFGLTISSESALAAGVVMGIMIIPFVSSLSDDVMSAVPQSLREGSYGLGATKSETIKQVILPAALPGVVGSLLLAASRAIGETMIVVMAAGLAANLTANPFEAVTTVTVQIVTLLVGDQEFDSAKTLAAFALGLILFCVTLVLNIIALTIVNKYREQYD